MVLIEETLCVISSICLNEIKEIVTDASCERAKMEFEGYGGIAESVYLLAAIKANWR